MDTPRKSRMLRELSNFNEAWAVLCSLALTVVFLMALFTG